MQQLRDKHDEALNAAKYNSTKDTIEELYKRSQTLKETKDDVMDIGEDQDMLMRKT